mgnify:CR=1 FL=1
MATNNPRGFVEYRHLGGAVHPATRRYRARDNGDASQMQHQPIRAGDPVVMVSGNRVARITAPLSAAPVAAGGAIIGIVRGVYNNVNGQPRPFTHNVSGAVINASADGWVEVNIDPLQTYLVNTDSTVQPNHFGLSFNVTALAAPATPGRSGMSLFLTAAATAANVVAGTAAPFTMIGWGAGDEDYNQPTAGSPESRNADVEVVIGFHAFGRGTPMLGIA